MCGVKTTKVGSFQSNLRKLKVERKKRQGKRKTGKKDKKVQKGELYILKVLKNGLTAVKDDSKSNGAHCYSFRLR